MILINALAAEKLNEMLAHQPEAAGKGLRIFVKAGGCRGFSYGMGFDKEREDDTVSQSEGIRVLVDPVSAPYLQGAVVDFKDAMMGGGFTISNPNATSSCGCGQSFKAKGERGNPQPCGSHSEAEESHGHSHGGGGCGSGGCGSSASKEAAQSQSGSGGCGSGGCGCS